MRRRYKLIFVDDEKIILESLLNLVNWKEYQYDVVGAFRDGEMAWQYLQEHEADIIVTDIDMPFMNGIEFLENLRAINSKTRCIFLTGYECFQYAQKAIQMKAFDYLLKPITKEALFEAVEEAARDIEHEENMHEEVGKGRELAKISLLHKVLDGEKDISMDSLRQQELFPSGSYLLMVITMDACNGQELTENEIETKKQQLKDRITQEKEMLNNTLDEPFKIYFVDDLYPYLRMVCVSHRNQFFSRTFIQTYVRSIFAADEVGVKHIIIVGKNHDELAKLQESYDNIRYLVERRHKFSHESWNLVFAKDHTKAEAEENIVLPTDTLLHHIRLGLEDEVEGHIKAIFLKLKDHNLSITDAKMITTELAIVGFKGEVSGADQSVSQLFYLNYLQKFNSIDGLEAEITGFLRRITNLRKESGKRKKGIAEKALEYLRKNYDQEDLGLENLAQFLNVSVPYLTVLLKQETGHNFGTHILTIRMEKAKELLKTTDDSILEISEKVGYSSSQYFAVRFKKFTGISPGAYRDIGNRS